MPLESSVFEGQMRTWLTGVGESQDAFLVMGLELDCSPQMVHTLERGVPRTRRMGDVLAWSEPL